MLQLVEIRVGTRKTTSLWHVRVNYIGLEIIKIRASWERFNMDESESEEGEVRTIDKWFVILDGVGDSLFCPAEVVGVDIAVLIQYLETSQYNSIPPSLSLSPPDFRRALMFWPKSITRSPLGVENARVGAITS